MLQQINMNKAYKMKGNSLLVKALWRDKKDCKYIIEDVDGNIIFKSEKLQGSVNLACFLGLAHSVSLIQEEGYDPWIYCNNQTALTWMKSLKVNASSTDSYTDTYLKDSIEYIKEVEFKYECFHYSWNKKKPNN